MMKILLNLGILEYLIGVGDPHSPHIRDGTFLMRLHKFGRYKEWGKLFKWFLKMYYEKPISFSVKPFGVSDWLRQASVSQLEWIPMVTKNVARFFKLHTDPQAQCVPLEPYTLEFIRSERLRGR